MLELTTNPFIAIGVCFLISIALTLGVRSYAVRRGFVATPKADRWHKRPTAMLGGIAIFLTTLLGYLLFVPVTKASIVLLSGSFILFIVGLIDDLINIRPYQKLIGQLTGVSLMIGFGLRMPITGNELFDTWITVLWMIGITNAINLLDNMDGLAAGISAIAGFALLWSFAANGQTGELLFMSAFVGALLGFLLFNSHPASIFMGDCGSMFVGFLLAGSVMLNQVGGRSRGVLPILAVPALILFVPIFDTTFVTLLRKLWGRSVSQGGRDHTSHRLVALGLSERSAVAMLYAFAIIAGGLSIAITYLEVTQGIALIAGFSILLVMIGVYLSKVKVYDASETDKAASERAVFAFLINFSHKRRVFEVLLDAMLITLSLYTAFFLVLGPVEDGETWDLFLKCLPIVVFTKLAAFLIAGVYRGLWKYTSIGDLFTFAKGVVLGSALSVLGILLLYRFQYYSRTVFVVDAVLLLLALVGSRMMFRLIRNAIPTPVRDDARRTLIYGAGDGGEMVLRELKNNPDWNLLPIGFIDDDPLKKGKVIHGLTVFEGNGSLSALCSEKSVQEILISVRGMDREKLRMIREICVEHDVSLRRAMIRIEALTLD